MLVLIWLESGVCYRRVKIWGKNTMCDKLWSMHNNVQMLLLIGLINNTQMYFIN